MSLRRDIMNTNRASKRHTDEWIVRPVSTLLDSQHPAWFSVRCATVQDRIHGQTQYMGLLAHDADSTRTRDSANHHKKNNVLPLFIEGFRKFIYVDNLYCIYTFNIFLWMEGAQLFDFLYFLRFHSSLPDL
jgi:hypothetical protein